MTHTLRILLTALFFALPVALFAQDDTSGAPPKEAATIADLAIPLEHLKLKLEPLTAAELETEAKAWQEIVKQAASNVADVAIRSRIVKEGSPEKTQILEEFEKARTNTKSRIERLNAVLDAWEAKGGDPAEIRLYTKAVSGVKVDLTDAASTSDAIRRWLTSQEGGIRWAIKLSIFAAILLASWIISRIVKKLVSKAMKHHEGTSELLDNFVNKLIGRLLMFIGLLVGLSTLGVNVSALVALIGGASFIIGFAMQDTLSNFANGLMLLIYQPFDVGDAVEIAGVSGAVEAVSLVNTTLKTFDNKRVIVPNKSVWGQVITNATANDTRRVDMIFGIGYEDDIEKALKILNDIVSAHELVLADPEPVIQLHELADSSVNFICRPWSKTGDYWTVFWDVTRKVKNEFDAQGISIPFPQQDIHIHGIESKA